MMFRLAFGVLPAAMETIIVSPIARDTARTIEAMMPETAAGKTTLNTISSLVEPRPSAPSRMVFGTELIASSLRLADHRDDHHADDKAWTDRVEEVDFRPYAPDQRRDESQCEEPIDDSRYAGKDFEYRLD